MREILNANPEPGPKKSSKAYTKWRVFWFKIKRHFVYKEELVKIFVYGTLRKEGRNFGRIKDFITSSETGTVKGRLYVRKDKYVFLTAGKENVRGELLYLKGGNDVLNLFDLFEGREYIRRLVPIKTAQGIDKAYVYYYAGSTPKDSHHIKSGDWITFIKEHKHKYP